MYFHNYFIQNTRGVTHRLRQIFLANSGECFLAVGRNYSAEPSELLCFRLVFFVRGSVVVRASDALFLVAFLLSVVDACSIYYCSSSSNNLLQYSIVHGL